MDLGIYNEYLVFSTCVSADMLLIIICSFLAILSCMKLHVIYMLYDHTF